MRLDCIAERGQALSDGQGWNSVANRFLITVKPSWKENDKRHHRYTPQYAPKPFTRGLAIRITQFLQLSVLGSGLSSTCIIIGRNSVARLGWDRPRELG